METYLTSIMIRKKDIRDRPFNLKGGGGGDYGFLFRSEILIWTTRELEYLFVLSRKARIFFPEFNILFQQHWESEYFFRKKTITPPPPPFKLNGRSLSKKDLFYLHGIYSIQTFLF